MKTVLFNKIFYSRLEKSEKTLCQKAEEYANDEDRLYNFKRAAVILQTTPEKALLGMLVKHLVSVIDIIESPKDSPLRSPEIIDEKIGDTINYFILLEAILKEKGCS